MTGSGLQIEPLSPTHVPAVARLHVLALTRELKGWAGQAMMALFYRELIASHDPPPGFAAVCGGKVVGFAVAVADAAALRRRVVQHAGLRLAALGLLQCATHPLSMIARLLRRIRESRAPGRAGQRDALEACCPAPRIEFRGIVVDPAAHHPGAALALMRARLEWAKAAGYRSIYFQIDPTNEHSIKLCQWAGAKPVANDSRRAWRRFYKVL